MKKQNSIFTQLVIFTVTIGIIPISILSMILFMRLYESTTEEVSASQEQMVAEYIENVQEKLDRYIYVMEILSSNTVLVENLLDYEGNAYTKGEIVSAEVSKVLSFDWSDEIDNCIVYALDAEQKIYGKSITNIKEGSSEKWYYSGVEDMVDKRTYLYQVNNSDAIMSIFQTVENVDINTFRTTRLALIKLDLHIEDIFKPSNTVGDGNSFDVALYTSNKIKIYSSNDEIFQSSYLTDELISGESAMDYTIYSRSLDEYNMNIVIAIESADVLVNNYEAVFYILPFSLMLILMVIVIAYYYSKNFTNRIRALVDKFKRAETGDLTVLPPIEGGDEISELDTQFSQMIKKIDTLIKTNYVWELENKEAQIKNLQLQINPHFLYNTLETMSSISAVKNVHIVSEMCHKLGDLFRYSLGKDYGDFVTVKEEMDHIENYIFIQKIRYQDKFEVFFNIDLDADKYMILRFILQPIVENAILHGLANAPVNGALEISVWAEKNTLYISIEDDGLGMEDDRLNEIKTKINKVAISSSLNESIGIRNVNQRIKLACGEMYGIEIFSKPNKGTRFLIKLPVKIRGGKKWRKRF